MSRFQRRDGGTPTDNPPRPSFGKITNGAGSSKDVASDLRFAPRPDKTVRPEYRRSMYLENDGSSTEEDDDDDEEAEGLIGVRLNTSRKRTYESMQTTSSSLSIPQSDEASKHAETFYNLLKDTNYQSDEQQIHEMVELVFRKHGGFFTNLRMFVSGFEGGVSAKENDFWKSGLPYSYKQLAKVLQENFVEPKENDDEGNGYSLFLNSVAAGKPPKVTPLGEKNLKLLKNLFVQALKQAIFTNVVSISTTSGKTGDDVNVTISAEALSIKALALLNQSFANLGIQLNFTKLATDNFENTIFDGIGNLTYAFEGVNLANDISDFKILSEYLDHKKADPFSSTSQKNAAVISFTFDTFFETLVSNVDVHLDQYFNSAVMGNRIFEWLIYDDKLKTSPMTNYLLELRHYAQQEHESMVLSAVGLTGDLRVDLMALLERMAKPKYFFSIQQAFDKVGGKRRLYDIINDPRSLGPKFANLCKAQFIHDKLNSSSYSSAVRTTQAALNTGQAIDAFNDDGRTRDTARRGTPIFAALDPAFSSDSQLRESIMSTLLADSML